MLTPAVWSTLPLELVHAIFALAASSSDNRTALSLSLVCSAARRIALPSLLHTVRLDTARALSAFAAALALNPSCAPHVRHLAILAPGPLTAARAVLHACAGAGPHQRLRSLALGFTLQPYAAQFPSSDAETPTLHAPEQHLLALAARPARSNSNFSSTTAGADAPPLACASASASATHLRLQLGAAHSADALASALSSLESYPALSHLALVLTPAPSLTPRTLLSALVRIADERRLEVVLVQVAGAARRRRETVETLRALIEQEGAECKIVVEGAPVSCVAQWEDAAEGRMEGVWDAAEREVRRRRRVEAKAAAVAVAAVDVAAVADAVTS